MPKFNKTTARPAVHGPLATEAVPTLRTHEGGAGYAQDVKTELFTLAVSNMVGEATFYETGNARDDRFRALVHEVAVADPAWMLGFVGWLRGDANMRSASLVAAAEAVKARLDAEAKLDADLRAKVQEEGVNRKLIAAVLQRADEPGELLAYWRSRYGRAVPKPVKRGIGDAVQRLYTEYALLKYDTASHGYRFADVLDLTHPAPTAPWQGDLFRYALDRRHGHDTEIATSLRMVWENSYLRGSVANGVTRALTDPDALKAAGMTWEDALSLAGSKVDKRALWEAMIPSMGYMALLRNLRNFDEAGVSDDVAETVAKRLADPDQVAKARQLPFRYFSAYVEAPSDRWKHPLGKALDLAVANVPELPGRTLVLIDTSGSMTWATVSERSKVTPLQAAAVLGMVLGKRSNADVWQWATSRAQVHLTRGRSALAEVEQLVKQEGKVGGGTDMHQAMGAYAGHDRVFILSDMQALGGYRDPGDLIPAHVPLYAYNLVGYKTAMISTAKPNRHQLGGYSDRTFQMVSLLERRADAGWPWQNPTG